VAKKITKKLIREHFGKRAVIKRKLFGDFHITTPDGGDVELSQTSFKIHAGGKDVYRAMVSLGNDVWGRITVHGPTEHVLSMMAHGEMGGVDIIPEVRTGGGFLRFFLVFFVFAIALYLSEPGERLGPMSVATLVNLVIWKWRKKAELRAARRAGQVYRDLQPDVYGSTRETTHDDAVRGKWL
jgi:hypothetical protein